MILFALNKYSCTIIRVISFNLKTSIHLWHYLISTNIEGATIAFPFSQIQNLQFLNKNFPIFTKVHCKDFFKSILPLILAFTKDIFYELLFKKL